MPWQYRLRNSNTDWADCTEQEKTNLQKDEFYNRFQFRELPEGKPTKNSVVKDTKKKTKKEE